MSARYHFWIVDAAIASAAALMGGGVLFVIGATLWASVRP